MCALCALTNKVPARFGCSDAAGTPFAGKPASRNDAVLAPIEDDFGNVGQNPGSGGDMAPGTTSTTFLRDEQLVRSRPDSSTRSS
jgi:hypothetical protein